jgi:asparagine synthetase B (glutamine-hydrolysing)
MGTGARAYPVRVAVLYSGGLDCTIMARMAHDILPAEHEIDLLNVAFENPRVVEAARKMAENEKDKKSKEESTSVEHMKMRTPYENCPDRITGRSSFQELLEACPGRTWRFVAVSQC